MAQIDNPVFKTKRLLVRVAVPDDVELIHRLWTDPRVTTFVGFPQGIPTSQAEIEAQIKRDSDRPLKRLLIAERLSDGEPIGEVKLGEPDEQGISEPDIKLFREHWQQGYGRELWGAMIEHLFAVRACRVVQGTPNVANAGSIRMMEGCGMVRVGEGRFEPSASMKEIMIAVPHYVYRIEHGEGDLST